jgi:signal transduction histidine kinase
MDADGLTSVDLLEEIRVALDDLDPLLVGRVVDVHMPRLRVLAHPLRFRRELGELIGLALAHSEPTDEVTVHVARTGKSARLEVRTEGDRGTEGPGDAVVGSLTLPMAPGGSSHADG